MPATFTHNPAKEKRKEPGHGGSRRLSGGQPAAVATETTIGVISGADRVSFCCASASLYFPLSRPTCSSLP